VTTTPPPPPPPGDEPERPDASGAAPSGGPYGAPEAGGPYGSPQYGSPQYGGPQYGSPQYGAPQYGGPPGYGDPSAPGVAQAHSGLVTIPGLGTVKIASFGQRAAARILDAVILSVGFLILYGIGFGGLVATSDRGAGEPSGAAVGGLLGIIFLVFVVSILYEPVMVALKGATLGKMALGLKIVLSESGAVPGWGPSFIRWILPAIASLVCGIGQILVYLSPLFDNSGRLQGWHDKAAHDLVISTR
jgi:uncharacterized RDD family membrane protein YckC